MMLKALWLVTTETFLLLRRDRIFLPVLLCTLVIAAFANIASDWSIADFTKVLFDIGFFGFQLTGALVAMLWGTKLIADARRDGTLEVQLAQPVGRVTWILGRFLGLALCLLLLGGLVLAIWQVFMLLNDFGRMSSAQLVGFAFVVLGWLVLGALATAAATLLKQSLAFFCTLALWLAGMASTLVASTLGASTPEITRKLVTGLARMWDLQQFNLVDHTLAAGWVALPELAYRAAYGGLLVLALITFACIIFACRDATEA